MKHKFQTALVVSVIISGLLALFPARSFAIPSLQIDILGGSYDATTETVVTTDGTFTLYALLSPDDKALLGDTYFISAAVVPAVGPAPAALGSFDIEGTTVNVTADMEFGTPPLDAYLQTTDPGDLPSHGIYETFFYQYAFTFDPNDTAVAYNSQDTPGAGPTPDPFGTLYYAAFSIDITGLDPGYGLHFDLYNTKNGKNANDDKDILSFAPFSHDGEACCTKVPEPGTLMMMGAGLVGLGLLKRKLGK